MGLKNGTRLQDRYIITEIIARGGEGDVYKAIDVNWNMLVVAIKETRFDDQESLRQFQSSAMILRELHHNNLPKVYDHFSEGDSHFLVMDYIEGDDLLALLQKRTIPFPSEQIKIWSETLLETVKYLHSRSPVIIHRDIKPQNIKLTSKGQLYLLDFGLAKQTSKSTRSQKSMQGYTLYYAPPEQISRSGTDERSDIYSLGATIFHLLAMQEPINAQVREQVIKRTSADPMKEMLDGLPTPFDRVIGRAMEIEPAARFNSAEEMLRELSKAQIVPPPPPPPNPILPRLILFVTLLGLVGLLLWYWTSKKTGNANRWHKYNSITNPTPSATATPESTSNPQENSEQVLADELAPIVVGAPRMVDLPGGEYQMGSSAGYDDEKPVHRVRLRPFSIGKYEVTQEEWEAVMGNNPSVYKGEKRPVENVSWNDVQEFLRKIGNGYRLPTEAEWEYAARGGVTTEYSFGDDESKLGEYAWFNGNAGGETHQVGQKKPNGFGLYDMHGNVGEWVEDPSHSSYVGAPEDGRAWISGVVAAHRVVRGGGWYNNAFGCRSAYRYWDAPGYRGSLVGFRLSRTLP